MNYTCVSKEREEKEREENKARRILKAETPVSAEIANIQGFSSLGIGPGYDNVVFHNDDTNKSLEKF